MYLYVIGQDLDGYDGEEEMECEPSHINQPNKRRHKAPMDRFVTSISPDILQGRKERKLIFRVCDKELREKACGAIARWFYDAGAPFNAVNCESFGEMIESIGQLLGELTRKLIRSFWTTKSRHPSDIIEQPLDANSFLCSST